MRKWIFSIVLLIMWIAAAPVEQNDPNTNKSTRSVLSTNTQIIETPVNTFRNSGRPIDVSAAEISDFEQPIVLVNMWVGSIGQSVVDTYPHIQQSAIIGISGEMEIDYSQLILNVQNTIELDYDGYLCLDREGKWLSTLQSAPETSLFQLAMAQGLQVIQFVRSLRPNAKIGYYALPFRRYFDRDAEWIEQAMNIQPLLDEQDVLFPSVYDFNDTNTSDTNSFFNADNDFDLEDLNYVYDNVRLALMVAGDKPVIPYVWQRFHPAENPPTNNAYQLIDDEQFAQHVSQIMAPVVNGRRAAGVCMWDASPYFFNLDLLPDVVPDYQSPDTYFDAMATHYICLVARNIIDASCSHPMPDNEDCDGNGLANYQEIVSGMAMDCNANNKPDLCDLADSPEMDLDQSGYLDACQAPTDVNGDGDQDIEDFIIMMDFWGSCPGISIRCQGDINNDSVVDIRDMLLLIDAWE